MDQGGRVQLTVVLEVRLKTPIEAEAGVSRAEAVYVADRLEARDVTLAKVPALRKLKRLLVRLDNP